MFKRLGVVTILVVLALMASVPAVSALGQISDTGVIWVDPLLYTPVQMPIPDISLPVAEAAQSAPTTPAAQPQGGPPPDQGQPLATGSIWVQHEGREIRINFNARTTAEGATGHIYWREEGQTIRAHVVDMFFNFGENWTCAFMSGEVYSGHETRENMCFMVCDDYDVFVRWNYVFYLYEQFDSHRGNLTIKP
ncbi:MAG: hypothetical protein K0B06_08820 [Brevefilum sp.]|nr:hypothetical protein [Brevefilum sp.]